MRSALIIGTSNYSDPKLETLLGPLEDAKQLSRVLADPAIGDFEVETVLDPKVQDLRIKLEGFFRKSKTTDHLLYLHLSCHGLKDDSGRLYFAATDTDMDSLFATAINDKWLHEVMDDARSQRIVLCLDCCFGGAFGDGRSRRAASSGPVGIQERFEGKGRVIVSASTGMQYAYEGEKRHGAPVPSVFTRALVEGLETGAADRDRDGRISVDELYDHVFEQVSKLGPNQTPTKSGYVEGDIVIARSKLRPLPPASQSVVLPREIRMATQGSKMARLGAVTALERLLQDADAGLSAAAIEALRRLALDDSRHVSEAAKTALERVEPDQAVATDDKADTLQSKTEAPAVATKPSPVVPEATAVATERRPPPGPEITTVSTERPPPGPETRVEKAGADAPWFMGAREVARMVHTAGVVAVAFSPDGSRLASAAKERTVQLYDGRSGMEQGRLRHGMFTFVRAVAFSPNGRLLATASDDHEVRLWDFGPAEAVKIPHKNVNDLAFSPDGLSLATAGTDKTARIWDARTMAQAATFQHDSSVRAVTFSPKGDLLATGAAKQGRVWEIATGREVARAGWQGLLDWTCDLVKFSPDGRRVASAGQNSTIRVWDPYTGVVEHELVHEGLLVFVLSLDFSPDGRYLVSGSDANDARIWDTASGTQVALLQHTGRVNAARFSPDGTRVATGSNDTMARLWDVPSGRQLATMRHEGPVKAVAFSPSAPLLATGSDDKTVRLWALPEA